MKRMALTPRERQIVCFVAKHSPCTVREIGAGVGLRSTSTVHQHLTGADVPIMARWISIQIECGFAARHLRLAHGIECFCTYTSPLKVLIRVLLQQLDGQEAPAQDGGVVIGPELACCPVSIVLNNNLHESGRRARIVTVFNYVLQPQAVGLILQLPLMPVDNRYHP